MEVRRSPTARVVRGISGEQPRGEIREPRMPQRQTCKTNTVQEVELEARQEYLVTTCPAFLDLPLWSFRLCTSNVYLSRGLGHAGAGCGCKPVCSFKIVRVFAVGRWVYVVFVFVGSGGHLTYHA